MNKLTKIVATIGPSSDSPEMIERLINAGVNVFRFNFKHNTVEWHSERVERVNKVAQKMGVKVGTLIDLQGPELRINMPVDELDLTEGELIVFGEEAFNTQEKGLSITHPHIIEHLTDGQKILADDGAFSFHVVRKGKKVYLESETTGKLKTRKTLNIPGADFPFPVLIERDFDGLKMVSRLEIDFVALSFVRTPSDVQTVRSEMKKHSIKAQLISKIETQKALNHLSDIIDESDGIMVARGDLGVEIPIEQVPYYQKQMIRECMVKGKFVITATQMLQTMIEYPYPTRAEVSDIANAVYDHTDCIMLSGETANGAYPLKAVEMMAKTASFYEPKTEGDIRGKMTFSASDSTAMLCDAAYNLYREYVKADEKIVGFVIFTQTGRTARILSRYRPKVPVYAFTTSEEICESLTVNFGVFSYLFDYKESKEVKIAEIEKAITILEQKKLLIGEGKLIAIHGDMWGQGSGATTIRII